MCPHAADRLAGRRLCIALALSICVISGRTANAVDRATVPTSVPLIEAYEPNVLGYTKQSDDVPFVDITVSLKYRLFRETLWQALNPRKSLAELTQDNDRQRLYLTFTGRFGFYVRTRHSDPVVAKNYNPKLLWRYIPDPHETKSSDTTTAKHSQEYTEYIDFAYAHDSDGQSIDTAASYGLARRTLEDPNFALDQVSRGWDYAQIEGKYTFDLNRDGTNKLSVYPGAKFFLRHGFLQGVPEEYHTFEGDPTAKPRHAYDGVMVAAEYRPLVADRNNSKWFSNPRLYIQYKTGYEPVARYNTIRGEFGFVLKELPIAIYVQDGYMDSLARYYKKARSFGVELRIAE